MRKPQIVEIQTINYCNAACKICPWPEVKPRVAKRIDDVLWKSLLEQIAEIEPRRVIPYLNNEPFLTLTPLFLLHIEGIWIESKFFIKPYGKFIFL